MASDLPGRDFRRLLLGRQVAANQYSLVTETHTLYNVTGGEVLITSLYLKVNTTMTVANTLAVQTHPTTGDTMTVVTATDLGTTDTAAGGIVGLTRGTTAASAFLRGGSALVDFIATTGKIELVTTGTSPDGAVTFYITYVPLTDGAAVTAA
jgi:hypothetical protein